MNIVGYLLGENSSFGAIGREYNYRLAGNGLFIMSIGSHIIAQIPVAGVPVRGLPPAQTFVQLRHGKIPRRFFDLALSVMLARPETEVYIGIAWEDGYRLIIPEQEADGSHVQYRTADNIVCELHSHCEKGPGFSLTDDRDELGFRIYGVVGDLFDDVPSLNLRLGLYGYFMPVCWGDVFDGSLEGITDVVAEEARDALED